jgi:hypothetical protein
MWCKTKQREDSRSDPPRSHSGLILGFRRITADGLTVYDCRMQFCRALGAIRVR